MLRNRPKGYVGKSHKALRGLSPFNRTGGVHLERGGAGLYARVRMGQEPIGR